MGRSSEAFFGYGIIYRPEEEYEVFDDFDDPSFSSNTTLSELVDDHEEKLTGETEWEKKWDAMKEYPVDLDLVGDGDNPSYFLNIKSALKRAEWDEEIEITPDMLRKDEVWNEQLREAATRLGLPWREPKFLMKC